MSQIQAEKYSPKKHTNSENSQLLSQLNQLLNLKVYRAVDRLFMENDVQHGFKLYSYLQQNVKQNTNQLRHVLYQKHENLINCSDMIDKLNFFATKIKNVQQKIDQITNKKLQQLNEDQNKEISIIQAIQKLMAKRQYLQAFQKCRYFSIRKSEIKDKVQIQGVKSYVRQEDIYYLKFLKLQIMDALQAYLAQHSLTPDLISQMILALKQFLAFTSFEQLKQISLSGKVDRNCEYQTLIDLLYQKYTQIQLIKNQSKSFAVLKQQNVESLCDDHLLQVIFKFKLFSLNMQVNNKISYSDSSSFKSKFQRVFSFFNDLNHLLYQNQGKQILKNFQVREENGSKNNLNAIFRSNIQKIMHNLSQIFIKNANKQKNEEGSNKLVQNSSNNKFKSMPILSFEYQLYEQLLNDQKFIQIIQSLSVQLFDPHSQEKTLHQHLKDLWYDYYHHFLQLICEQINPLIYQNPFCQIKTYSSQFLPFIANDSIRRAYQILDEYQQKVEVYVKNIHQLVQKSKHQDFIDILEYFKQVLSKINCKIQQYQLKLAKTTLIRQQNIRQFLLIILCCQNFNVRMLQYFESLNKVQIQKQRMCLISNSQLFSDITIQLFSQQKNQHLNAEQWQLQIDQFFGVYKCSKLQKVQDNKLSQIILNILRKKVKTLEKV